MPTYGYECTACKHRFEVFQRITEEPVKVCEKCGSPVHRLMYPVGIVFKGSGFYVNDNRSPNPGVGGTNHGAAAATEEKKPEPATSTAPVASTSAAGAK